MRVCCIKNETDAGAWIRARGRRQERCTTGFTDGKRIHELRHELATDEDESRRRFVGDIRSLICCSVKYSSGRDVKGYPPTGVGPCVSRLAVGAPSVRIWSLVRNRRTITELRGSNPRDARFRLIRECFLSFLLQKNIRCIRIRRVMRLPRWC